MSPVLGGGTQVVGERVRHSENCSSLYDLLVPMQFLFVHVVKARDLPSNDLTGSPDPFVELKLLNYKGVTRHFEGTENPEWNTVFAFSRERIQSSVLEVIVKDKHMLTDDFIGMIRFDLNEIPTRVPPDDPLAPEWYQLRNGELMLAVWMGTQADEALTDAWHWDTDHNQVDGSNFSSHVRSKVYDYPRLWYLRVNVIEAHDFLFEDTNRFPHIHVRAQIGYQVFRTKAVQSQGTRVFWNEDLMLVAAEPFVDHLELTVKANKVEAFGRVFVPLGKVLIPLVEVQRRLDDGNVQSRWFDVQNHISTEMENPNHDRFASRLHARISLDGGYHVLDGSAHYSSDLRPAAKQLWKPAIGVLGLGILEIDAVPPTKVRNSRGTSDTYCVAKYGHKWVRTRTIVGSLNPNYNEQYTWEVFDPATVLTIGVFTNCQIGENDGDKDTAIGKVRIQISTLETGRVYTHSYPLLVLHPSGVRMMGELHLAIRFSCSSMVNMMNLYSRTRLPKMHYTRPLTLRQLEALPYQAVRIVAAHLSHAEPPLRKEVIEYMTDDDLHRWSIRRSKANYSRLLSVFNGVKSVGKWFTEVCRWRNPVMTLSVHFLFIMLICFPVVILPTLFLYMFLIGAWNYRYRPKYPPHMNIELCGAESASPDELDEEFDTFPTTRLPDIVRMRYDRLRIESGRIQKVIGDLASAGERLQALLSWRDPHATVIFMGFCIFAASVLYVVPFQLLVILVGVYVMRHPKFRHDLPTAQVNFFCRLPASG